MAEQQEKKYPNSKKLLIWGIIVFGVTTIAAVFIPIIVTRFSIISLGVDKPNEIGDTIGGILGPTVALIAAGLTFLAFWAQFDANIKQRKQFDTALENEKTASEEKRKESERERIQQQTEFEERQRQFEITQKLQQDQILLQDKRARVNLFETRFHALLSIHRDNATNMTVNKITGQKTFIHLLDELSFIYKLAYGINKTKLAKPVLEERVYNVAYLSFFFGVGEKSSPMVQDLVNTPLLDLTNKLHSEIKRLKSINSALGNLKIETNTGVEYIIWDNTYELGTGHLRRLSHYVRHLFQTVKFVHEQPKELLKEEEKYNYISNLRAQLTVHEQLLLYYNAISVLGKPWLEIKDGENFIEKYCILKSMPPKGMEFYKRPEDVFPKKNKSGKIMFEWTEIQNRLSNID